MKHSKLMKSLVIRHKISVLKKQKSQSRFVEWERDVKLKLMHQEAVYKPMPKRGFTGLFLASALSNSVRGLR